MCCRRVTIQHVPSIGESHNRLKVSTHKVKSVCMRERERERRSESVEFAVVELAFLLSVCATRHAVPAPTGN